MSEVGINTDHIEDIVHSMFKYIARNIDDLDVEVITNDKSIILSILSHPEDTGCIIGREGNNIKALRNLVASYAIVNDDKRKIFVEVDSNEDIQPSDSY